MNPSHAPSPPLGRINEASRELRELSGKPNTVAWPLGQLCAWKLGCGPRLGIMLQRTPRPGGLWLPGPSTERTLSPGGRRDRDGRARLRPPSGSPTFFLLDWETTRLACPGQFWFRPTVPASLVVVRPFTLESIPLGRYTTCSPYSVTLGLDLTFLTCGREGMDPGLCLLQG